MTSLVTGNYRAVCTEKNAGATYYSVTGNSLDWEKQCDAAYAEGQRQKQAGEKFQAVLDGRAVYGTLKALMQQGFKG